MLRFLIALAILLSTSGQALPTGRQAQAQVPLTTASGDPDLNLTIFPPTAYLTVKPETTMTHRVLLEYLGVPPVLVTPELVDFKTDGLTGAPILQKPAQFNFIRFQNPDYQLGKPFLLTPGSRVELVLEISPPAETVLGEYPLSLVLTAQPNTNVVLNGSSAQASGGVASNVILSIQDDYDNQGQLLIKDILTSRWIDSFTPLKFIVTAQNSGRNAVAAGGQIKIKHNWSKEELQSWHIYPDVVLAHSTRGLRGIFPDPSQLQPEQEIEFVPLSYKPPFLIGPYEITAQLSSANQPTDSLHQRTQIVYAFPFSVLGLLGLGIIIYWGYHRLDNSVSKKRY